MMHVRHLRYLTPVAAMFMLTACATVSTRRQPGQADSLFALTRLDDLLVEHTRAVLQRDVALRLALGLRLDRMPSEYALTRREQSRAARAVTRELEEIWYNALRQDDYVTLLAVHWDLQNDAEAAVYRTLDFTSVIPGTSLLPAIARALAEHPIEHAADVQRYLFLLEGLAQYVPEMRQALVDQARNGIRIPDIALDSVLLFLEQYRQPAARSPFALSSDRLTRIDSAYRPIVIAALSETIGRDLNPQLDSLLVYLRGPYRVATGGTGGTGATGATGATGTDTVVTSQLGLGRYPGGQQYYQYLLRRATTLEVAPNDLFTYGTREVQRLQAAMTALRASLGFRGSDSAFRASLQKDARFTVQSPNDFERRMREALAELTDTVRARYGVTMQDSVVLLAGHSQVLDGARSVRLREGDALDPRYRLEYSADRVVRLPAYVIPGLVARELLPGRAMLLSAVARNDSLATIRQLMRFPGFVDGWGEHARGLAGELGLYSDPYVAYGTLMLELEAAARMVTDLGVHQYGWSYPQAVRYLRVHSVDTSATGSDVLRIAVAEPARAVAAKIGSRELAGQRAWVRRELGATFDDGALQREVLRVGVLPLPVLSQHLAWWVYTVKGQGARDKGQGQGKER